MERVEESTAVHSTEAARDFGRGREDDVEDDVVFAPSDFPVCQALLEHNEVLDAAPLRTRRAVEVEDSDTEPDEGAIPCGAGPKVCGPPMKIGRYEKERDLCDGAGICSAGCCAMEEASDWGLHNSGLEIRAAQCSAAHRRPGRGRAQRAVRQNCDRVAP